MVSTYLATACFDVDGGSSSSSHGHTDTETAVFSATVLSSHGHTACAPDASICSDIDFDPSLKYCNSILPINTHTNDIGAEERNRKKETNGKNTVSFRLDNSYTCFRLFISRLLGLLIYFFYVLLFNFQQAYYMCMYRYDSFFRL